VSVPNDAEWATFIWAGAALVACLTRSDLRQSMSAVVRTLAQRKILTAFLLLAGWAVGEVLLGQWLRLWNLQLTTDTAIWYVTVASVLLVHSSDVGTEEHYLRKRLLGAIALPVIVGVVMQLFVPSLLVELLLQPVLFLLVGTSVVATQDESAAAKKFIDTLIAMAVLALAGYQVASISGNWSHLSKAQIGRQFAMPVWLSLGVLPWIYLTGVYATYETAFVAVTLGNDETRRRRVAKRLALLLSFHIRAHEFSRFMESSRWPVRSASSFREVRRLVGEHRREREAEAA
jgi:hypothetical protein